MTGRMHPQDLRLIVEAIGLFTVRGPATRQAMVEAFLAEVERTAEPPAPAQSHRTTPQVVRCTTCGNFNKLQPGESEKACFCCGRTIREEPEPPIFQPSPGQPSSSVPNPAAGLTFSCPDFDRHDAWKDTTVAKRVTDLCTRQEAALIQAMLDEGARRMLREVIERLATNDDLPHLATMGPEGRTVILEPDEVRIALLDAFADERSTAIPKHFTVRAPKA